VYERVQPQGVHITESRVTCRGNTGLTGASCVTSDALPYARIPAATAGAPYIARIVAWSRRPRELPERDGHERLVRYRARRIAGSRLTVDERICRSTGRPGRGGGDTVLWKGI